MQKWPAAKEDNIKIERIILFLFEWDDECKIIE